MDTSLGERSKTGASTIDPAQEFINLYDTEMPRVYRYIAHHLGSAQEAEDITSEVFQRAFQNWPQLRQANSKRAWLMTVANHLVSDYFRRHARPVLPFIMEATAELNPEEAAVQREDAVILIRKLGQLPVRDRTVLTLRFAGDLSHREIAEVLGISEDASAVALYRALRRLREAYEGEPR